MRGNKHQKHIGNIYLPMVHPDPSILRWRRPPIAIPTAIPVRVAIVAVSAVAELMAPYGRTTILTVGNLCWLLCFSINPQNKSEPRNNRHAAMLIKSTALSTWRRKPFLFAHYIHWIIFIYIREICVSAPFYTDGVLC